MTVAYCTREDVKLALDVALTARSDTQVDRAILGASSSIESLTHRVFYPTATTKYWDWPNDQLSASWRLWLDAQELVSVTSLTSGGAVIAPGAGYILRPENTGPPYSHVEINLGSGGGFTSGSATFQQSIAITGLYGGCADTTPAGTITASIDASATTVAVSDSSTVGTLDTVLVGTEYMTVTARGMTSTGQTLQTTAGASVAETSLAVTSGAAFHPGEILLLDAERVLIIDVAGNSLIVKRSWDGTVLAAHTGSTIYAPRSLTVARGQLGTTAAAHTNGAAVSRHTPPPMVRSLAVAESLVVVLEDTMGWTSIKGEGGRSESLSRLEDLRGRVYARHGRKIRTRAI